MRFNILNATAILSVRTVSHYLLYISASQDCENPASITLKTNL